MWVIRQIRDRLQKPKYDDQRPCPSPTGCLVRIGGRGSNPPTGSVNNSSSLGHGGGGGGGGSRAPADDDGVSVGSQSRCCGSSCRGDKRQEGRGLAAVLLESCSSGTCAERRCRAPRCTWWKSLCSRVYLVAINLASFIGGWSLIALAIWLHAHRETFVYWPLFRDNPTDPLLPIDQLPIIFALVGLFFAIMSFLGCCGACTDSVCFLGFYTLFLVCIIVMEATVGVLTTALKQQMSVSLMDSMRYQVQREYNRTARNVNQTAPDVLKVTLAWDSLQSKLNCCGVDGPQDYVHSSWFNHSRDLDGIFVPASCCSVVPRRNVINENFCQVAAILYPVSINDSAYLNTQGCHQAVLNYADSYSQQVFGAPLSLLIMLQIVALVLTCILLRWVKKKQSDYWWYVAEDCE